MIFTIYLTTDCNFKCTYCYENFKQHLTLKEDDAFKIVDYIMNFTQDKVSIVFLGGEPLLQKNVIFSIINYINSNYADRKVNYMMTTNASLINKEVLEMLEDENFQLRISIDGNRYTHELNRKSKNGIRYFDKILHNLGELKRRNIRYTARMTVTNETLPYLYENIKWFTENNIKSIFIGLDNNGVFTEQEFRILDSQLESISEFYIQQYKKGDPISISQFDGVFLKMLWKFNLNFGMCSAGRDTFKILPNLDIYPCEYVVDNPHFRIGNINEGIDFKKSVDLAYENFEKGQTREDCHECKIADYCYQMKCGYSNYVKTGKINIPCDSDCRIERINYKHAKKVLLFLAKEKNDILYEYIKYVKDRYNLSDLGLEVEQLLEYK